MRKKGFTLIEIIVCLSLVTIIGVFSFFGVRLVNNNIRINKLSQITDKAIQAAQVYIETNKEASSQLYREKNGVVVPLNVLVNEGLLDLSVTTLDDKDIEDEYVITALSTENDKSTECTNIDSKASWDKDNVIYICTNLNSGSTNLQIIDPTKSSNAIKVSKEPYYFRGANIRNYAKLGDIIYQILYIDTDDSIVLYTKNITTDITNLQNDIVATPYEEKSIYIKYSRNTLKYKTSYFPLTCSNNKANFNFNFIETDFYNLTNNQKYIYYKSSDDERINSSKYSPIDRFDLLNTINCNDNLFNSWILLEPNSNSNKIIDSASNFQCYLLNTQIICNVCNHLKDNNSNVWYTQNSNGTYNCDENSYVGYKFKLKDCYKIKSGNGTFVEPYILSCT